MIELFHSITACGNTISVTLTKLAQAIAEKSEETHDKLQGSKDDERSTKNGSDNIGDEGHLDTGNSLCNSWLGRQDSNLRMLVPKTSALPLGHAPIFTTDYSLLMLPGGHTMCLGTSRAPGISLRQAQLASESSLANSRWLFSHLATPQRQRVMVWSPNCRQNKFARQFLLTPPSHLLSNPRILSRVWRTCVLLEAG